ncbi:DUF2628 domain-containing protein [Acetobacter syzygii]|uniref:DUF2628 domain-containing protein n=1 Tax=Acetobacter syzygii TaxID=146476 RepID=A0A270B758_9PROT|nr:DUF2628 domain-containing protein [Acetobacter syzygii]NSL92737.1 DUF2628 domain-containing protein [Acetobacter syzygii]PAL20874.1 hypothetical protein B9K05_12305 [Acetobacter syzygii]PAL22954.1 hypothetical protein B9K04_12265 [Acetobacter syzygii]
MKSFNIYEDNNGNYRAIKNGWSWPAFFFGSVWALCMQIWIIGVFLFPIELFLNMFFSAIEQTQRHMSVSHTQDEDIIGSIIAILALCIRVMFGVFGNACKRKKLLRNGYILIKTLSAKNKKMAILTMKK